MRTNERKYVKGEDLPKPQSIIIMDSYNNDYFPLQSITIDPGTSKRSLYDEFRKNYNWSKTDIFFPWHYMVELNGREVQISSSRPHNYKSTAFPQLKDSIVIMIVGNTDEDSYLPEMYKKIVGICIHPYTKIRVNNVNIANIEYHKLGSGFARSQIQKIL